MLIHGIVELIDKLAHVQDVGGSSDRAYVETCKLNGLDDFLTVVAPLEAGPAVD